MAASVMVNAVCVLHPTDGVSGTVRFTQSVAANGSAGTTHVTGNATGLAPGNHQLHICAFGDLTNGGTSCGPLFDPRGSALKGEDVVGDLGVFEVGEDGVVTIDSESVTLQLTGPESIIGRSFVLVHVVPPPDPEAAAAEPEAEPAKADPKAKGKGKDAKPEAEAEAEAETEVEESKPPETTYVRKAAGVIGIAKLHQSMLHAMKANLKSAVPADGADSK